MSGEKEKGARGKSLKFNLGAKFWRTFLTLLAALLTFTGPTYVVLVLFNIFEIGYAVSMVIGFVLFLAGLALIWYLVKKKIIS